MNLRIPRDNTGNPINVSSNSLGAIVRGFKSAVTYSVNKARNARGLPIWQRNYHEHIIRDSVELERIRQYIFDNPGNWAMDEEFR